MTECTACHQVYPHRDEGGWQRREARGLELTRGSATPPSCVLYRLRRLQAFTAPLEGSLGARASALAYRRYRQKFPQFPPLNPAPGRGELSVPHKVRTVVVTLSGSHAILSAGV